MRHYSDLKVEKLEKQLDVITCNKCGKEFVPKNGDDFIWDSQIHWIQIAFSYGSGFDTEVWHFDLCDNCLVELTGSFQVKLEKEYYT